MQDLWKQVAEQYHVSAEEVQAEITKAEERVKAYFMQYDTITYDGRPLATFKTVTSHRLDSKALKADNPDIYAKYIKESTTRQLLFK